MHHFGQMWTSVNLWTLLSAVKWWCFLCNEVLFKQLLCTYVRYFGKVQMCMGICSQQQHYFPVCAHSWLAFFFQFFDMWIGVEVSGVARLLFWYNREREKDFVCEFFLSYLENLFWNIHCERKNIVASAFFRYGKRALFWSFRNEIERTNEIRFFFWSNVKKHDLYQKRNSGTRYEFLHVVK